ncbi:MAG: UDP-N-acetylmuramate dehydrogenase, partial [Glaciecola sp.]
MVNDDVAAGADSTVRDPADGLALELADRIQGKVTEHASLAQFTTLRVGGKARVLVEAAKESDLVAVGRACLSRALPWAIVGRGSNLLVADDGFPGVVIVLGSEFRGIDVIAAGASQRSLVVVGGAEPLPTLARTLAEHGLDGMAWAAGVPGTLGGGVRMNAGAHGGEIRDHLVEADVIRLRSGSRETWPLTTLGFSYRHSELPDDAIVLSAMFSLATGDREQIAADVEHVRKWRREHQPINLPNCGSVFTNPVGDSAGRLIEDCGAKGLRIGGAQVSTLHGNFIVTERGSRADDVHALIAEVQRRVQEAHGVRL